MQDTLICWALNLEITCVGRLLGQCKLFKDGIRLNMFLLILCLLLMISVTASKKDVTFIKSLMGIYFICWSPIHDGQDPAVLLMGPYLVSSNLVAIVNIFFSFFFGIVNELHNCISLS